MSPQVNWLDRVVSFIAPRRGLDRVRARAAQTLLERHYEAATPGRRSQGWHRSSGDANAGNGRALGPLRDQARDLVRNNGYAEAALDVIVNNTVGWGIVAAAASKHQAWKRWSTTTACDADGRSDLIGIQKTVMRAVVQDGEVLVRRRWRRLQDGLPLPLQLQVLEADFLDTGKDTTLANGHVVVQGVEFDALGRRVAYWLFRAHPGSSSGFLSTSSLLGPSYRVPAEDVLHIFKPGRPGQVRGPSWYAPVLLKFRDFDELDDAQLMKQKIAACLAIITTDVNGEPSAVGTASTNAATGDHLDLIGPGAIINAPIGRDIKVVEPPRVGEYGAFAATQQRGIAAGLHVPYEEMTGDYSQVNFSSARMSRLRHWASVLDWRWQIQVLQLLNPVWAWGMQASELAGIEPIDTTEWTAPPMPMIEPDKEGLAISRNVRGGVMTPSEAIRERGYNVDEFLAEYAEDLRRLDELGIVLDSDARKVTQAGQLHSTTTSGMRSAAAAEDDAA
jgi:lambda family phage portal protein